MLRQIAHLLRFGRKDQALEKRFAQIKERYLEASQGELNSSDPIAHLRSTGNFDKTMITGTATTTREKITEELLKSCARVHGGDQE